MARGLNGVNEIERIGVNELKKNKNERMRKRKKERKRERERRNIYYLILTVGKTVFGKLDYLCEENILSTNMSFVQQESIQ